ncbi:MAG: hypothetical protein OEZ07_00115 [Dehalococcoidia bacterium]|nr:hypothetical protein [Dehalococcoidia bacterium]MDH5780964.1 hypothetical protein [Dehalococcoidia bacterium]
MRIVRAIFSGIFSFVLTVTLVALGIVITVNLTVLNPNFIISELDKLDIYSIVADQVKNQIPAEEPYIAQVVDETITDLEPWLREQTATVIYGGWAYLKGDQELNIVIPLEQVRATIKDNLEQAILESLPPELEGFSESQIQAFLSQIYAEIDSQIPQQIEIDETALGPEITTQLQQARQIVGYIELGYKALIGLAALLILLIALLQWWHVKPIARYVGIPFTTAGALSLISTIVARSFIPDIIPSEVPPEIVSTLSPLITDFTSPLQTYGIVLLIAGIGLIVLSIKLKSPDYAS